MKCVLFNKVSLLILALMAFVAAAEAQTLSLFTPSRDTYNSLSSGDSIYGPFFNSYPGDSTNTLGAFHGTNTSATPAGQHYVSAQSSCVQDSVITASATTLSITGQVQVTSQGAASQDVNANSGSADWYAYSRVTVSFYIDRPFIYSLQGSTAFVTNQIELAPSAYMALSRAGYADVAAFGNSRHPGYTSLAAAGTNTGILPPGNYSFHAEAVESGGVDPMHSPTAENYFVSFVLNVTPAPPPPTIGSLAADQKGAFRLIWTASQAGNYRVLSSTNLINWSENIPTASHPAGPNTNTLNFIPGSSAAYFVIQFVP